jgi:hypothetical protein
MFPVSYGLNFYINLLRNSVFKGLNCTERHCEFCMRPHYTVYDVELITLETLFTFNLAYVIFITL